MSNLFPNEYNDGVGMSDAERLEAYFEPRGKEPYRLFTLKGDRRWCIRETPNGRAKRYNLGGSKVSYQERFVVMHDNDEIRGESSLVHAMQNVVHAYQKGE